jgi:MscS family membrane protein
MFDNGRRHHLAVVALLACLLGICTTLSAQVPGVPAQKAPLPAPADPLGRQSPFGTITGFSSAVHRHELNVAARYLQAGGRSPQQLENLAEDLSELLDRYFTERLTALSSAPTGDLADGLDADREPIHLVIGDRQIDLFLRRVKDPAAGEIWLVSSDSLARVPSLSRSSPDTWIERIMPASLVSRSYAGLSLAQWILVASSFLAPLLVFCALAWLVPWVVRQRTLDVTRRALIVAGWTRVRWPLVAGLTLLAHLGAVRLLGFSVTTRVIYTRFVMVALVLVATLLAWRLVGATFQQAGLMAMRRGRSSARSLIQLGERVAKVLVVLIAMFVVLRLAGVDPTTALAGVGIAGVAVALGAQKSVENLLGAVFLLTDRALAVGDFCRLSDRDGWVEDITLRSVRLRTLDQTLLSVPAGLLSQGSIENYTTRQKILLQSVVRLRYGTTCEQLETALNGMRQLLAQHPSIEQEGSRVRLTSFAAQSIEIEMFAYVMTADYLEFLEIREALLLQVARIVEASGAAFAIPTQFIYMRPEADEYRHLMAHPS